MPDCVLHHFQASPAFLDFLFRREGLDLLEGLVLQAFLEVQVGLLLQLLLFDLTSLTVQALQAGRLCLVRREDLLVLEGIRV
uniref:Uncharacterized protein n=1 Tax=Meloidogyne incognita TaxID=6306 RepID=A0A914LG03_MELIC